MKFSWRGRGKYPSDRWKGSLSPKNDAYMVRTQQQGLEIQLIRPLFLPYALGGSSSPPSMWRSYIFIPPFQIFSENRFPKYLLSSSSSSSRWQSLGRFQRKHAAARKTCLSPRIHTSRVQQQYSHLDDTLLNGSRHSEKRKGEGRAAIKIICSEQKHTQYPPATAAHSSLGGERIPRMPKAFRNSNRSCQSVDLNVMNTQDNIQN